jgi:hypothetical protein
VGGSRSVATPPGWEIDRRETPAPLDRDRGCDGGPWQGLYVTPALVDMHALPSRGRVESGGGTSPAAGLGAGEFAMIGRAFDVTKRAVKRSHESGARLHTGTDVLIAFGVPGASLHRELHLFVDAGLTPEEALAVSTRDSAADLGVPGLGTIAPGAPADLVVFREDPTRSLDALDSIAAVIRGGRLYGREALDDKLARYRARYDGALYDAIVTPIVRRSVASTRK